MHPKESFELSKFLQFKPFFQSVDDFFDVWLIFFLKGENDVVYEKETEDILFIDYIRLLKDLLESLVFQSLCKYGLLQQR